MLKVNLSKSCNFLVGSISSQINSKWLRSAEIFSHILLTTFLAIKREDLLKEHLNRSALSVA